MYNRSGKITKMIDQDKKTKKKKTLSFAYNSLGKPTKIRIEKIGEISVSYDNYGEIQKVYSKSGHKNGFTSYTSVSKLIINCETSWC